MDKAKQRASTEIAVYKERRRIEKENKGEVLITDLLAKARSVVRAKVDKKKPGHAG